MGLIYEPFENSQLEETFSKLTYFSRNVTFLSAILQICDVNITILGFELSMMTIFNLPNSKIWKFTTCKYNAIVPSFRHLPHRFTLLEIHIPTFFASCYKHHLKAVLNKTQITLLWLDIKTQDFSIWMIVLLKLSFRLMKCYCKKTNCLNFS